MSKIKNSCLKAGMRAIRATGGHKLVAPWSEGVGLIFTLHEVNPEPAQEFDPNRILRVTPDFLKDVIGYVRDAGLDIVSLDEAHRRLTEGDFSNRFVCFTLDDGYRDNKEYAYPIFKEHDIPFTIYVPGDYPSGEGILWWRALQDIIAKETAIEFKKSAQREVLSCADVHSKWQAFDTVYWWLRDQTPGDQKQFIKDLSQKYEFDLKAQCRKLIMTWDEIRELNKDPLVTIGAHTMGHDTLAKLTDLALLEDTAKSIECLRRELGERPHHVSYPYGDATSAGPREFALMRLQGFKTAVTTRKGVLFEEHHDHLTALPRVSLNGDFQSEEFVSLYLSGAVFALWNGFKKVNVG